MIQHYLGRLRFVDGFEAFPRFLLCRLNEAQHQRRIERPRPVVAVFRFALAVIHKDIAALCG